MKLFGILFSTAFLITFFFFKEEVNKSMPARGLAAKSLKPLPQQNYRRSFVSLGENIAYEGLLHIPGHDSEYTRRLFGKLIQKSHSLSHADLLDESKKIYLNYNTFLLTALQVPSQEGKLMHVTKRDPQDWCYFSNNVIDPVNTKDFVHDYYPKTISKLSLEINNKKEDKIVYANPNDLRKNYCYPSKPIKKSKDKAVRDELNALCRSLKFNIVSYENAIFLLTGHHQFQKATNHKNQFKSCSKLDDREEVNQLLFANDYSDVGLMMFNSTYHSEFFSTGKIFKFDDVIDHGLEYLYQGYLAVAFHNLYTKTQKDELWKRKYGRRYPYHKHAKKLSCFDGQDARTFKGRTFVMRGAWAGKYNSGQVSKSCRFTSKNKNYLNGKFRKNDTNYQTNLAKLFKDYKNDQNEVDAFQSAFSEVSKAYIKSSLFHLYLPKGSLEEKAFRELIDNVYHGKNSRMFLKEVLDTDYNSKTNLIVTNKKRSPNPNSILVETVEGRVMLQNSDTEDSSITDRDENLVFFPTDNSTELDFDENGIIIHTSNEPGIGINQVSSTENFQRINKKKMTHIIVGSEVNIRKAGKYGYDQVCGNTRIDDSQDPLKVDFIGIEGDFTEIKFHDRGKFVYVKGCLDRETFFIYTPQVIEIEDYSVLRIIKLKTFTSVRDGAGTKDTSVIGSIGPGSELKVINEHIYTGSNGKDYLWYQYMAKDGTRPWLFAGIAGGRLKVKEIK
jgi:hypothetical protein